MVNVRELLAKATKATAYMYDREATVTRNVTVVKPNGAETEHLETIYDAIPCRISYPQTSIANAAQGDVNAVAYDAKMFCSPEYELKQVTRSPLITSGESGNLPRRLGLPTVQTSHAFTLHTKKCYCVEGGLLNGWCRVFKPASFSA